MREHEVEKAAIMAVLKAETDAWLQRDFEKQATFWVHSPKARHLMALASLGTIVDEGWDAIAARKKAAMAMLPHTYDINERVSWDRVNINVGADMAWVSYDQIGSDAGDDFEMPGVQHEVKIFQKIEGAWKLACLVIMQRTVEHVDAPLVEVDEDARIIWMNVHAHERIGDHPGLLVSGGRLRARNRSCNSALRKAVAWAFRELRGYVSPAYATKQVRAVSLGEDDAGAPMFCWVLIEDNKTLISFDDKNMIARRIELAQAIYGLSSAQVRLACMIIDGYDLASASEVLGVSINTLRTHLQRMFDKMGVRNQTALVRALLSAEAPTK
jgi:DNA-binding CsgD family transcriptional regulator